jgi:predicted amidophosphoribosyltransferase
LLSCTLMAQELIENDLAQNLFERRTASADEALLAKRRRFDRVMRWLRSCAVCHCSLPPIDLLCGHCWRRFELLRNRGEWLSQPGYPFPVYSLLSWTDENDAFVRPFIYGMKRGWQLRALEKLTQILTFERNWGREKSPPLLVHPASSNGIADHSKLMGLLFAEAWGREAYSLEWDEDTLKANRISQKRLNASARAERRFDEVVGEARFTEPLAARVFVDDVITSGATAWAAHLALGRPEGFEVWALVSRPKLATSRGF